MQSPPLGDYDGNGTVEEVDYNTWSASFGQIVIPLRGADGNSSGDVEAADYVVWRKFLAPQGQSNFAANSANVFATEGYKSLEVYQSGTDLSPSYNAAIRTPALAERRSGVGAIRESIIARRADDRIDLVYDQPRPRAASHQADEFVADRASTMDELELIQTQVWSDDAWLIAAQWRPRLL
jgi:hypothetical protein